MIRRLIVLGAGFAAFIVTLALLIAALCLGLLATTTKAEAACGGSSPNLTAATSADFTSCLSAAVRGDTITLTAGNTYQGTFVLTDKGAGTSPIIIQSSDMASLPAGVRVSPSSASHMAKIVPPDAGGVAFQLNASASYFTLRGLEVTTTATPGLNGVSIQYLISGNGDGSITYETVPHHIVFDRMYIHPYESDPSFWRAAEKGIALNGSNITITNNYIADFGPCGTPTDWGMTIASATNASPVVVTLTGTGGSVGQKMLLLFRGGTGGWAAVNGGKVATNTGTDQWSLQDVASDRTLTNVDTTGAGSFSGQTIARQVCTNSTTHALLFVAGPGPYLIDNNFLNAYYSSIFTGGGGLWVPATNVATVQASPAPTLTTVRLDTLGNLQVGDRIAFEHPETQTITGAVSSGSNCTGSGAYTCLTVATHGFPVGTVVQGPAGVGGGIGIQGFTGAWAALNDAAYPATVIDSTHLRISVDTSALGASSGSPTAVPINQSSYWATGSPIQWCVGHVTAINAGTKDVTYEWWGHQPQNVNGNGCGFKIQAGSSAVFNGANVDGITLTHNTLGPKQWHIWLMRDIAGSCDNCGNVTPKGIWEAKSATNVLIQGNRFGNQGPSLVNGGTMTTHGDWVSVATNTVSQYGGNPWISTSHWIVRSNLFGNGTAFAAFAMQSEYFSDDESTDLLFENNLQLYSRSATFDIAGGDAMTFRHNTAFGDSSSFGYAACINVTGYNNTNSIFRDNVCNGVSYRWLDQEQATPWAPTSLDHNFFIDAYCDTSGCLSAGWNALPAGSTANTTVNGTIAMKLVNATNCMSGADYRGCALAADSPGHNAASDGTDAGVNFAALDAALGGIGTSLTGTATLSGHGSLHQ